MEDNESNSTGTLFWDRLNEDFESFVNTCIHCIYK